MLALRRCSLLLACTLLALCCSSAHADPPQEHRCATMGTAYSSCFAPNICCGNTVASGCRPPDGSCCGINKYCEAGQTCCGDNCCKNSLGTCCGGRCCLTEIPQPFTCTADLRCVKLHNSGGDGGFDDSSSSSSATKSSDSSSSAAESSMWTALSSAAISSSAGSLGISSSGGSMLPTISSSSGAESMQSSSSADALLSSSSGPQSSSAAEESSSASASASSSASTTSDASSSADAAAAASSSTAAADASSSTAAADASSSAAAADASSSTASESVASWSSSSASDLSSATPIDSLSSSGPQEQSPAEDLLAGAPMGDGKNPNITNTGGSSQASTTKTGAVGSILAILGGMLTVAFLCNLLRAGTGTCCFLIATGGRRKKPRPSPDGDPSPTESNCAVFLQVSCFALCLATMACDRYASLRYNIVTAYYGLDHIVYSIDGDYGPDGEKRTTKSEHFQCGSEEQSQLDSSRRACDTLAALSAVVFIFLLVALLLTARCCVELLWLRYRNLPLRVSSHLSPVKQFVMQGPILNFVACQWAATSALFTAMIVYISGPYLLLQESIGNTDATARIEVGWILCLVTCLLQLIQTPYWIQLEGLPEPPAQLKQVPAGGFKGVAIHTPAPVALERMDHTPKPLVSLIAPASPSAYPNLAAGDGANVLPAGHVTVHFQ